MDHHEGERSMNKGPLWKKDDKKKPDKTMKEKKKAKKEKKENKGTTGIFST